MATTATERKLLARRRVGRDRRVDRGRARPTTARSSRASRRRAPRRPVAPSTRPSGRCATPLPAHKRAEILVRVAGALGRRADEAARQICGRGREAAQGRTRRGRARDVDLHDGRRRGAERSRARWCRWTPRRPARASSRSRCGVPIGVVGAISPFNFPLNLVAHKIAPALAAGCAVVLKPASQTPLSALLLAELEHEAGLPPGWLNVVVGPSSEIGDVIVEDERVTLITFTGLRCRSAGSSASARRASAVNLELGQRDAGDRRARRRTSRTRRRGAPRNAFSFAGQSCISVQRIFVHEDVYDDFKRRASSRASRRWCVGDPADENTDVGPLICRDERERVARLDRAGARGRRDDPHGRRARRRAPRADGRRASPGRLRTSRATRRSAPSARSSPTTTLDEAIERANATRYGLQAGIFTGNVACRARRRPRRSSSAASPSTRRRRSAPTRCPTAASRTPATPARGPRGRCGR